MEGRVYYCGWKQNEKGWQLWVHSNPRVKGQGHTLDSATESLWNAVIRKYNDGEPQFEFRPPLPDEKGASIQHLGKYVTLSCGDNYSGLATDEPLKGFIGGFCDGCGKPKGPRSKYPLKLESRISAADGITIDTRGASLPVFSEDFLSLLSNDERASVEWREVILPTRSRMRFFEPIFERAASYVAPFEGTYWIWKCDVCGQTPGILASRGNTFSNFVSEADVPVGTPLCGIWSLENPSLAIRAERWSEILEAKKIRSVSSREVYLLPKTLVGEPILYSRRLHAVICEIEYEIWERERDRLMKSEEVLAMKADPRISDSAVWDYIHAMVDDQLTAPAIFKAHREEIEMRLSKRMKPRA